MRVLVLSLLVLFAACSTGDAPPAELLDRERFKMLLLEAQLIEARVNHELVVEHSSAVPTQRYYDELFEKEGVTREQFESTFRYYSARPEEMKLIYEEIVTELSVRKDAPMP
jgi:hypothetical protein